jgi:chromosome segregation ATPase
MKNSSLEKSIGKIETEVGKHTVILEKHSKDISTLKEDVADLKKQTSRIGVEVIKHTEAIEQLPTRSELDNRFNNLTSYQDKMMSIMERLDQERLFTFEAVKRLEVDVERNNKEIKRIKEILKV